MEHDEAVHKVMRSHDYFTLLLCCCYWYTASVLLVVL